MPPESEGPTAIADPPLLLVAHGTRDPAGTEVIELLADAVRSRTGVAVAVSYVDVVGPTVAEALQQIPGPVVAVPAFLAAGYHVRHDLPAQIQASRRDHEVVVTASLGPDPVLAEVMSRHLRAAGWQLGDRVVFAAAGSRDPRALADVSEAASLLGQLIGARRSLQPAYITTARPRVSEVCFRTEPGHRPGVVAPYLLAPGLFHRQLRELADGAIADPIGTDPRVADLIARRYRAAYLQTRLADQR